MFFQDIAKQFNLLPALGKQLWQTAKSQATDIELRKEIDQLKSQGVAPDKISKAIDLHPEVQDRISLKEYLSGQPTGGFFGDIAKQFNLVKPQEFIKPKEIPTKPELPTEFPKTERLVSTLKEIARTFPREGAGAVIEVVERVKGIPRGAISITPGAGEIFPAEKYGAIGPKVEKFIFGEKPVEGLGKYGEEVLKGFGISETSSKTFGLTAGMVFLGLDLLPVGSSNTIKLLAKANKADDVKKILFGLKGVDNAKITDEVVNIIAKTTDEKTIKGIVEGLSAAEPKVALKVGGVPEIPKELQPLTQEAIPIENITIETPTIKKLYPNKPTISEPIGENVVMYHGTSDVNFEKIIKNGLRPTSSEFNKAWQNTKDGWVYLARDENLSNKYALQSTRFGGKPIILKVETPYNKLEPDLQDWKFIEKTPQWKLKDKFIAPEYKKISPTTADSINVIGQARQALPIDVKNIKSVGVLEGNNYKFYSLGDYIKKYQPQLTDFFNQAVGGVKVPSPLVKTEGILPGMKAGRIAEELPPIVPPIKEPPTIPPRAKEVPPRVEMEAPSITKQELASDTLYQKTGVTTRVANEAETIAKELPTNPTKWNRFTNTMRRFATSFKEKVVNDWQRVKELGEKPGLKLTGELTPYERRKLMAGRQTVRLQKTEEVIKGIDKDILDTSKKLKIKDTELQNEVFDYLKARHAPERNVALGEKAAGITTKEAGEITARLEKSPHAKEIKRIADDLQKFHNETLDILYAEGKPWGVIDKELYDLLRTKYKNHIPLNRVMDTDDIVEVLSGKGLAVRGTGLRRAVGSEREVKDIMENIYTARTQAIQRVEKNIVDNETFQFVEDYIKSFPEQDLFSIVKPKAIGKTFEGKIILKQINDPTILQFQRFGKPTYIKINDARLAVAIRGVNRERLPGVMRYIATVTRWMSALVTRYSPEFALSNKVRDMQEAVVYMASQKDIGFKGATKMLGRDPGSINDVKNFILGNDTEGVRLYKQMIEDGGTTGGMALSTRKQVEETLKNIQSTNRSISQKAFGELADSVNKWNTIFEDSTRLSAYKQALKDGLSREKAVLIAKQVSIDFNEFGTMGPIINSLYMFANASIQGSAKMIRAMKDPKVAAATVGTVGAAVFAANEWNDNVDPEWRNKVSKWDKLNGLNIVIPGTEEFYYISIPVSWGLKPIKVAMEYASDIVGEHKVELGEMTEGLFVALMEGYNPVGGTDFASALTPSPIEPFIDIARNRQWTGSKIRPDWNQYAPASTQYFKDLKDSQTGKILINISQSVSEETGGRIEFSPADAEYILQQITGGPGKFTSKVFNSITAVGKAEVPEPRDIPFISRILRKTPEERFYTSKGEEDIIKTLTEQERERFYDKQEAEKVFEELKKMPVEQRKETYKRLDEESPQLIDRVNDIADEEEKGLTRLDRQIIQLGVENGERAKYLYKVFESAEPQERKELYREYFKKGIISDNVKTQLDYLFAHPEKIK